MLFLFLGLFVDCQPSLLFIYMLFIYFFRAGSVIVDANVYFLNVNSSNRNSICSQLRNVSSTSAPSNLEIESVETTSFGKYSQN